MASGSQHAAVQTGKRDSQLYQAREVSELLWDLPTQLVVSEDAAQPSQNRAFDHSTHASAGKRATDPQCHGKHQLTCRHADWREGLTELAA